MINVGIIGSGFIVAPFIEATKLAKGFRYVGIAARNEEKLKAVKEKYDISYYSTNNDDVINDPKIDVIYVAVPNGTHYEIAKKALMAGKHVIMEKPFTPTYKEAKELIDLAKKKNLIIFDAVTLLHMPNYKKAKEIVEELGDIKMVDLNFSQYSSRYDKFKKGIVLPAFDTKHAGGALMDLGIYNLDFVMGIFGVPKKLQYFPNIHKGIDTSGVLVLDYGKFKVNSIAAKDCRAPMNICIQGDKGYLKCDYASSLITVIRHVNNAGEAKEYRLNKHEECAHYHEYMEFKRLVKENDLEKAQEYNEFTLKSIKVLEKAIASGNIKFKTK
ncbi:MAG: Gfo/Idh/MocA family oxidoreductase [Erysipelotrichaceae bacterium]|nr:Gfo/Idh/MocA family oxidoreductase [Erysipelotrichaceae bacterium]